MSSNSFAPTVARMPPSERRFIAVCPDHEVAAHRAGPSLDAQIRTAAGKFGRIARSLTLGPILSAPVERVIDAVTDKLAGTGPEFLHVTGQEAADAGFVFPGHAKPKVLYALHPADPLRYYPVANFHTLTFEHKFSEVMRLLVALGATEVTVEHQHGWSRDFAAKVAAPVSKETASIDLRAKANAASKSTILFAASYEGTDRPSEPQDLVWYPQEDLWQSLAMGRIEGGMNKFDLELRYDSDFGINIDLAAKAEKAKIDIGGKFQQHTATVWKIHGTFRRMKVARRA
jgi:hypothetical protein